MKKYCCIMWLISVQVFGYNLTIRIYPTARDIKVHLYVSRHISGRIWATKYIGSQYTSKNGEATFSVTYATYHYDSVAYYIVAVKMGHQWLKVVKIPAEEESDRLIEMDCEFTRFTRVGNGDFLYSFIIITDPHVTRTGSHKKQLREMLVYINDILDDYEYLDPKFLMVLGDLSHSDHIAYTSKIAELETAKVILNNINTLEGFVEKGLFYVPLRGNHDVGVCGYSISEEQRLFYDVFKYVYYNLFKEILKECNCEMAELPVYDPNSGEEYWFIDFYFEIEDKRFLCLDFNHHDYPPTVWEGTKNFTAKVLWGNGGNYEWLMNHVNKKNVLIFAHHPFRKTGEFLWWWDSFSAEDYNRIADSLIKYNYCPNILGWFAGHTHKDREDFAERNGIHLFKVIETGQCFYGGSGWVLQDKASFRIVKVYGKLNPPSNLTAQILDPEAGRIRLQWKDNSNLESHWKIYYSVDGGDFTLLTTIPTPNSWKRDYYIQRDITLETGHEYKFEVRAYKENVDALSHYSNIVKIDLPVFLLKPTNFAVKAIDYSNVKLTWCDNSRKNTGYEIWHKEVMSNNWQVDTVSDTTCAIVDNLDYHKEYYFKVRAIDDKGHASAFSDSVKCQPNYFYPVNDLKAHQIVERILKIEWDYDKLHNGFYIYGQRHLYPGEPADGDFFSAFVPADSFSYITDSLSFGKWHITVKAIYLERDGDTIYSEPCDTSAKVVPNAPSNFVAVPLDEATVNLKWCDRSNYETGYLLEWFNREHGVREKIIFPTNTSDTTIELLLGTNILKLCAFYATTETLYSAYESTSIYLKPNAPSDFTADAIGYDEIELKWKDNSKYEDYCVLMWKEEGENSWQKVFLSSNTQNYTFASQPYRKYEFRLYCFEKIMVEPDPYYEIASDTVYTEEYSIPVWSDVDKALFANNNRKFDPPVLMFTKQGKIWLSQNLNAPFREEPLQNGRCPACVSQYSYAWIETEGNKEYLKIKTYYPDEIRAVDTITINIYPRKYFSTPSLWFTDRPYLTVEKLSVPLTGGRSWSLIYIDCTKLPADVYGASGAPGTYLYNYRKYKIASREEIGIVEIDTGHYIASPSIAVKDSFVFIAFSVNDSLFLTRIRKMPWNRFMSFRVCDSIVIDTIMFVSKGEHPSMDISSSGDLWLSWVKDDTIYWALIEPVYQSASTSSYTLAYIPPQPDDIASPEPEPEPEPEYTPAFIIHRLENLPSYSSNFPQILAEKGLVWMQKEGGIWRIKLAKWDAGSENWETPQTVSGDTNCYHPQIGIKDDEIYVAYTRGDKAPYEIKFYSTEEIPAPSPSPPEKPSHCPILATFVDSIYIVENNILNPFRDYFIDFYPIRFSPSAVSGKYKFTIFEGHRDRVYLDGVALIVVEHPESVKIGLTSSGKIFGYDKISHPLFCYNQCGQSVLSLVKYADGWRYRGDEKDVLFVCFDISGMGEDIAIRFTNQLEAPSRPPEYPEIPPEEIPSPEAIKKEIEAGNIVIFPEDAPYQCERVMGAYPPVQFEVMAEGEIFYQREIPAPHYLLIHVPQGQSGYLWLRVNYPCAFALDEIVACNVTENITPTLIYPQSAKHSIEGEMKDKLCDTNRTFVQLRIGERLDIEFDTIPHTQKLSFIFVSAGYYRQEFPPLCRVRYVKENLQNMEVDMRCVRNKLNRAIKELVFAESTFSDSWHCVNRTFIRINKSVLKMKEAARLLKIRGKGRNGEIDSLRSWSFLLAEACDLLTLQKMREVNLTNTVRDSLFRLAIKAIKKGRDYYNTPAPDMQILGIEWYCYNLAITGFHTAYVLLSAMEHVCRGGVQSKFDFDKVKFRTMPNPVRDYLTVRYYLPDKIKVRFRIYDVTGRVVEEKSLYDAGDGIIKMRVKHLPQGVYFLHIDAESQKLIKKFVKIH